MAAGFARRHVPCVENLRCFRVADRPRLSSNTDAGRQPNAAEICGQIAQQPAEEFACWNSTASSTHRADESRLKQGCGKAAVTRHAVSF